ncbi:putative transcription factor C2H2 family [Rosa chinensis]|uniref:RING-type E3 ubiquitin transferase n=1 Tax=Rosa chinensis TaxID=74649 RepID=A0A2P6Q5D3_ROSCH|nr:putative transcription factor C2H2 family [Rosa chinensis]
MGVPQDEQPAIVAKIFEALKVAVPFRPICVVIKDIVTVQERSGGDESSNKVRFDSLEVKEEEQEEEECVICLEGLSDFGPKSVTHLPCSHIYHGDCILKWQEKTQKSRLLCSCPVCRCPIPIVEMAGEPSQQLSLSTLSRPPQYQYIYEEDVDTDPLPEPSWRERGLIEVAGCTVTTLLMIPLCFVMCPC